MSEQDREQRVWCSTLPILEAAQVDADQTEEIRQSIISHYEAKIKQEGGSDSCTPEQYREGLKSIAREMGYVLATFEQGQHADTYTFQFHPGLLYSITYDKEAVPNSVGKLVDRLAHVVLGRQSRPVPFNLHALERFLLKVQDIPGLTVQSVIRRTGKGDTRAGERVDLSAKGLWTVDLTIRYTAFSGFASIDNAGPDYAGPVQMTAGLAYNSPLSPVQRLDVTAFSTQDREQRYVQGGMLVLLDGFGTRLRLQAGHGVALPGGDLGIAGFRSQVSSYLTEVQIPIQRSRRQNLGVSLGLEVLNSEIAVKDASDTYRTVTESDVRVLRLGTQFENLSIYGLTVAETQLNIGIDGLDATSNDSLLNARPDSRSDFHKIYGRFGHRLGLLTWDLSSLDLDLSVAGQYAFDILPPNQKFLLGGGRVGRGYDQGILSGDHAVAGTAELMFRYSTVIPWISGRSYRGFVTLFGFHDYGMVWEIAPFDEPRRRLHSTGIGVRLDFENRLLLNLTATRRLILNPTRTNATPLAPDRVLASALFRF